MATAIDKIKLAKAAASSLGQASTGAKNNVLKKIAELLPVRAADIIAANKLDLDRGVETGLAAGLMDRLTLNETRIQALASAVLDLVGLPDPVGDVVRGRTLPNGLKLSQIRVPLGVIGAIYEARPNVTIDIAALAIKAGNAVALRGGTAAEHTNMVLVAVLQEALASVGLPADAVQTVDDFGRQGAVEMMQARGILQQQ